MCGHRDVRWQSDLRIDPDMCNAEHLPGIRDVYRIDHLRRWSDVQQSIDLSRVHHLQRLSLMCGYRDLFCGKYLSRFCDLSGGDDVWRPNVRQSIDMPGILNL